MRLLADELRVPRSTLSLIHGATSRTKVVAINTHGVDNVLVRWPGLVTRPA
jgi:uncharacterized protein YggU (UPF0235/DUF167 family)